MAGSSPNLGGDHPIGTFWQTKVRRGLPRQLWDHLMSGKQVLRDIRGPRQRYGRAKGARSTVGIGTGLFRRRRAILFTISLLMFMLVVAEMLARRSGLVHAIRTRYCSAHLESECKREQVEKAFDHGVDYSSLHRMLRFGPVGLLTSTAAVGANH